MYIIPTDYIMKHDCNYRSNQIIYKAILKSNSTFRIRFICFFQNSIVFELAVTKEIPYYNITAFLFIPLKQIDILILIIAKAAL